MTMANNTRRGRVPLDCSLLVHTVHATYKGRSSRSWFAGKRNKTKIWGQRLQRRQRVRHTSSCRPETNRDDKRTVPSPRLRRAGLRPRWNRLLVQGALYSVCELAETAGPRHVPKIRGDVDGKSGRHRRGMEKDRHGRRVRSSLHIVCHSGYVQARHSVRWANESGPVRLFLEIGHTVMVRRVSPAESQSGRA